MSIIDWWVLGITIAGIVLYGTWKSRGERTVHGFLLANERLPWYHVGLSVMATQASAITFLSAPGQAYSDGIRFVQFYFGLPLAMVVLCVTFIPRFKSLSVYTAYEYLESRFDSRTRVFTAFLFLVQRGLSTGITIYAPALILSLLLNIRIEYTTLCMGGIVILYTVYGGTKAVSYTQLLQMSVIFGGLIAAAFMVVRLLPEGTGFGEALHIAGKMGRANALDLNFDLSNRYNLWSGLIGGFFLQLSYFGTDQSQVGRYLTGRSVEQSRLGLIMNGLVKIPMQFFILMIGLLVFAFYQFNTPPVFFNPVETNSIQSSVYADDYRQVEEEHRSIHELKKQKATELVRALEAGSETRVDALREELVMTDLEEKAVREKAIGILKKNNPQLDPNDSNYVFLRFVMDYFPVGLVGLLVAIIFLASMGSTASGLNSLASTTVVDIYRRYLNKQGSEQTYLRASRLATVGWGLFCVVTALYASRLGNLIEAVNILGSLFYGTILGIFLVAFYVRYVGGKAVFAAALLTELAVVFAWKLELMAFLWLNLLGCILVVLLGLVFQAALNRRSEST